MVFRLVAHALEDPHAILSSPGICMQICTHHCHFNLKLLPYWTPQVNLSTFWVHIWRKRFSKIGLWFYCFFFSHSIWIHTVALTKQGCFPSRFQSSSKHEYSHHKKHFYNKKKTGSNNPKPQGNSQSLPNP